MAKKDKDRELVGQRVKEIVEGTAEELAGMFQPVELPPEISDEQIKQALLDITPEGYEQLLDDLERQGVPREETVQFITQFSQRRQW